MQLGKIRRAGELVLQQFWGQCGLWRTKIVLDLLYIVQAVGNLTTGLNYTGEPCTSSGVQVLHQYSFHPQVGHHAVNQASFKLNNIAI